MGPNTGSKSTQKIFCLPFNGDADFAIDTAKKHGDIIREFYGDDGLFASGRHGQYLSIDSLRPLISVLKNHDISFNYTLNASSLDSYLLQEEKMRNHLRELRSIGVDWVTIAHPVFAGRLKDMGFHVSCSAVQCISSVPAAKWAQTLGYDRIVVAEDINRNVSRLRDIIAAISIPAEIIINNVCILHCPWRMTHYSLDSIVDPFVSKAVWDRYNAQILQCRHLWREDPVHFLKATWMRPEEIEQYTNIGIRLIKLVGRDWSSERLRKAFEIYFSREHFGFVFDYLRPDYPIEQRYGIRNVMNKELDEYFTFFYDGQTGCDGLCNTCSHCETYAKRLFFDHHN